MAEGKRKGKEKIKKASKPLTFIGYRSIICETSSRLICILLPC